MTFDLEKARDAAKFDDHMAITMFPLAIAEIERLQEALDESERVVAHKTKSAAHWYDEHLQARADRVQTRRVVEQQAARIQELEDAHKRSGAKYAKIINELRSSVYANMPGLKKQWDEILNAPANGKIGPDAEAAQRECQECSEEFCDEDECPKPRKEDVPKHCYSCGKSVEDVKGDLCKGDYFIGAVLLDPVQEELYYFACPGCAKVWLKEMGQE